MKNNVILFNSGIPETKCEISRNIVSENANGRQMIGLESLHLSRGRIFIEEEINRSSATDFSSVMRYCCDEKMSVEIFLHSGGGEVNSGLLMYDIIQAYPYPIDIYCTGLAASMAAVILAGGRKGHRFILPHSKVMIHEPLISGGLGGSATTIEKTAESILETRAVLNGILAKHTGKTIEEINAATVTDNYMTAEEAIEFGICDEIKNIFETEE